MNNHLFRKGQGLVEYALLMVLVAVITAAGMQAAGVSGKSLFCKAATGLGGTPGTCSASLFQDDFNGNLSQWNTVSGTWVINNGKLCNSNGGQIFAPVSGSNYVVTLTNALLTAGNGYGLFFRAANFSSVNGYDFQFDPGVGGFVFRQWFQGNEFAPSAFNKLSNYDYYSQPHTIAIVVQNNTFTAIVDNVQVLQMTDSTYTQGGIGLRTWDSSVVCFDKISVTPLP
jgi:Flp pilus assembly pilin Flp